MHKWRQKYEDHAKPAKKVRGSTFGELDDTEVGEAADDVYTEALKHRAGVIARDKAAKARRSKARG